MTGTIILRASRGGSRELPGTYGRRNHFRQQCVLGLSLLVATLSTWRI